MIADRLPVADLLAKAGNGDFFRGVAATVLQMLMAADVTERIGAARHERAGQQPNDRNDFHERR